MWQNASPPLREVGEGSQKQQADDVPVHCKHESIGSIAQSRLGKYEVSGIAELDNAQG